MTKKQRKRKQKKPEKEWYEFEVEDWEMDYHFELNNGPEDLIPGVFWENSTCTFICKLISPLLKYGNKARVEVVAKPALDDHWTLEPTVRSAKGIGNIDIPRGEDTLIFHCLIPSRSFQYIPLAASSGKIKSISISGTKLKWRKGDIYGISLLTNIEEK